MSSRILFVALLLAWTVILVNTIYADRDEFDSPELLWRGILCLRNQRLNSLNGRNLN